MTAPGSAAQAVTIGAGAPSHFDHIWLQADWAQVHAHHQPLPLLSAQLPAWIVNLGPDELAMAQPTQAHPDTSAIPAHHL